MKLFDFYEDLLNEIEKTLKSKLTIEELAGRLFVSPVHLKRLFKDAFGIPIASYIRSRRLAESLLEVTNSSDTILDIAINFGFGHAQSFMRAFKKEFGILPGELRKTGKILQVRPPLQMFPHNRLLDGAFFGPNIVYVPEFCCVGIKQNVPDGSEAEVAASIARDFVLNHADKIPNIKISDVYYGITTCPEDAEYTVYMPSVCTNDLSDVPYGYVANTITSGLYAKYHYIGEHHPMEINSDVAYGMYEAIDEFNSGEESRYVIDSSGLWFERIALSDYDGTYCKMEWFTPLYER